MNDKQCLLLDDAELEKVFRKIIELVKTTFEKPDTSPFYALVGKVVNDKHGPILDIEQYDLLNMTTYEERNKRLADLGNRVGMELKRVFIMVLVYEIFLSPLIDIQDSQPETIKKAIDDHIEKHGLPKDDPESSEVVVIVASTVDNRKHTVYFDIDRSGDRPVIVENEKSRVILDSEKYSAITDESMPVVFWDAYKKAFQSALAMSQAIDERVPLQ